MDEWLCSSTHNKDDIKALDKCAPLGRFISFVPFPHNLWISYGYLIQCESEDSHFH